MSQTASPLKPPPADIKRIVRLRDKVGADKLYDALYSLVTDENTLSCRTLGDTLEIGHTTAWKLTSSLPLKDISNMSHAGKRAALHDAIESPEKMVVPSVHPAPNQYLTNVESEALVQLIDIRAHNRRAIGKSAIRQYAADLRAQRLGIRVALPSTRWYYNFERDWLQHCRPLKPTAKEHKRASAERASEIRGFFTRLKALYDEHQYTNWRVWAADETGLEGDATSREKVQVPRCLPYGEQIKGSFRDHVSAMHMCNGGGDNLAPIFSFIGTWFNPNLLEGAPEGSKTAMQHSGYFEQPHMKGFLMHMIEHMDRHPENYYPDGDVTKPRLPCLLILDGAKTHLSGVGFEFAMQERIHVIFLPPNLTHIMQVADVGVFGAFKIAYRKECEKWRNDNRDREMDKFDIAAVTAPAWKTAMTAHNAISGFRKVGQWPFDPSAVLDKVQHIITAAARLAR